MSWNLNLQVNNLAVSLATTTQAVEFLTNQVNTIAETAVVNPLSSDLDAGAFNVGNITTLTTKAIADSNNNKGNPNNVLTSDATGKILWSNNLSNINNIKVKTQKFLELIVHLHGKILD